MSERRYETGEMGRETVLRGAFRGHLGAGVREALGWPQNVFSSRPYVGACSSKIEGVGNLTDDLTEPLTTRLTDHLTHGLTE